MPSDLPPPASAGPAPAADRPVIVADALTREFDGVAVVRDLSLSIAPGTIVGLIGPSGCGKTTTVRMLTGLLEPSSGTATIDGTTAADLPASRRRRIGYLPQTPALFPDLSVWENLSFHASMYGLKFRRKRHLRELLDWVELGDDRRKRVSQVSGGMQRRLALAATFVHDPAYVFLDEPTAGIDPILRDKFWQEFRGLRDQGRTFVITTQYVGEASHCDLVGLLSDGELLMLDTPHNLRRAAFGGEVLDVTLTTVPSPQEVERIAQLDIVVGEVEHLRPDTIRIVVDDAVGAIAQIGRCLDSLGLSVVDADEHVVDYDEAFVRVVERHRTSTEQSNADRPATEQPEADREEAHRASA